MRILAAAAFGCVLAGRGLAQEVFEGWDFAGEPGDQVTSITGQISGSFQAGAITRGSGLTAAADADSFNSTAWTTTSSLDTANTNGDYLSFTLTPNPGVTYSISQLVFKAAAPTSGSPDSFALRSSLDGFTANLRTISLIVPSTTTNTLFLSSVPSLQNVQVPITFRLIGASATSTSTSFRLEGSGNDLEISGTIVPEPACGILLGVGFGLLAGARTRAARNRPAPHTIQASSGDGSCA